MSVRFVGSERLQRGRGIGGLLRLAGSVFKPLLSKAGSVAAKAVKTASKIAKSKAGQKALKALKEQAIDSSLNIATDVLGGAKYWRQLEKRGRKHKATIIKKTGNCKEKQPKKKICPARRAQWRQEEEEEKERK